MSSQMKEKKKSSIDGWMFFPPLIFIALLVVWVVSDPVRAGKGLDAAFQFVTSELGWAFEWFVLAIMLISIYLCDVQQRVSWLRL